MSNYTNILENAEENNEILNIEVDLGSQVKLIRLYQYDDPFIVA